MKAARLLAQRETALATTKAQIKKLKENNKGGAFDLVLNDLYVKEKRQENSVKAARAQVEAFNQLGLEV